MGFSLSGALKGAVTGFASGGGYGAAAGGLIGGFSQAAEESSSEAAFKRQQQAYLNNWNLQNEYNSPVAQMERLRAAGLNPMLVYGSGNVTGNSSSELKTADVSQSYPQGTTDGLLKAISKLDFRSKVASTEGQELQTEHQRLQNDLLKLRIKNFQAGNDVGNSSTLKEQYNDIRRDTIMENNIRGSFRNGWLGSLPVVGNFLSSIAYENDYKLRSALARKKGNKSWQNDTRSIFK